MHGHVALFLLQPDVPLHTCAMLQLLILITACATAVQGGSYTCGSAKTTIQTQPQNPN